MKVLFFTLTFSSGGSEAFIVNLIEKIDKEKYEVELMCINDIPGIYDERLKKLGVEIQTLDNEGIFNPFVRYVKSYKAFNRFINKNKGKYEVIHFCLSQGEDLPFIHIAKRAGVPIRILHSHNSSVNSTLKYIGHVLCKALYKNDATSYLACSEIAAEWLIPKKDFRGKNYKIIKNGIDVEKYQYKVSERTLKRLEIGTKDRPIFLNIGRLNHQKNQSFLIDVFYNICKQLSDALLLVAGEGNMRLKLEAKTEEMGLTKSIYWLGNRNDISELLSASDVFLLPSIYEGLPYTVVEAQASGIECVIADTITEECVFTDLVSRVPLEVEEYTKAAVAAYKRSNQKKRTQYSRAVKESGFDIWHTVAEIENIYDK